MHRRKPLKEFMTSTRASRKNQYAFLRLCHRFPSHRSGFQTTPTRGASSNVNHLPDSADIISGMYTRPHRCKFDDCDKSFYKS